jgi:Zn-dependent peptidase ImmA (M78 family)/DNA-binding XRE family transcriptional regulator
MPLDLMSVGKRLREARQNCGLTQEHAAQAIGLPRTALVHIENGSRGVSMLQLSTLADLYRVPVVNFLSDENAEDVLVALRVSASFRDDPNLETAIARCVEICREGVELTGILGKKGRTSPPLYDLPEPNTPAEAVRQGTQVAEEERKRVGAGDAPIHMLSDFLTSQGIWPCQLGLPDQMSGLFLHHESIGIVIIVNEHHGRPRKRFSYMHEYAHALMDRRRTAMVSTNDNSRERSETRANAFSASFLMPERGVRSYLATLDKGAPSRHTLFVYDVAAGERIVAQERMTPGAQEITYQDVASLARYFGASYHAAVYRLQSLGIINGSERDLLLERTEFANKFLKVLQYSQFDDEHQVVLGTVGQELTRQVIHLAMEAFRRGLITPSRLDELAHKINVSTSLLRALVEAT